MNCKPIPNNLNKQKPLFLLILDWFKYSHNIEINYYLIRYLVICTSFYKQNTFSRFETWTKKMKCEIWKLINNYCENMYLNFVFAYLSKKNENWSDRHYFYLAIHSYVHKFIAVLFIFLFLLDIGYGKIIFFVINWQAIKDDARSQLPLP